MFRSCRAQKQPIFCSAKPRINFFKMQCIATGHTRVPAAKSSKIISSSLFWWGWRNTRANSSSDLTHACRVGCRWPPIFSWSSCIWSSCKDFSDAKEAKAHSLHIWSHPLWTKSKWSSSQECRRFSTPGQTKQYNWLSCRVWKYLVRFWEWWRGWSWSRGRKLMGKDGR